MPVNRSIYKGAGVQSVVNEVATYIPDASDVIPDTSGLVVKNKSIVGSTKTKITYDAKGLVTGGADATTGDIADSADKRYCTDAQKTVVGNTSGTNTGDSALYSTSGVKRVPSHTVEGSVSLVAGTAIITLTNAAVFTSATSYTVNISRTITTALIGVVNNSGAQFTITSANLLDTDTIRYVCTGD
jgi:hypothetical protein